MRLISNGRVLSFLPTLGRETLCRCTIVKSSRWKQPLKKKIQNSVDLMLAARIPLLYSDELGSLSLALDKLEKNDIFK